MFKTRRSLRLALRLGALLVGLAAAYYADVLVHEKKYVCGLIPYGLVVVAALLEFVFADVVTNKRFPVETERKLQRMEQKLGAKAIATIQQRVVEIISKFAACDTTRICATVHVLIELAETADHRSRQGLLQLTDYVGPAQGSKGRIILIDQGVIGRCARTHSMETVDFASAEEYAESMVRDFGFTKHEASKHRKDARSYLAFPLLKSESETERFLGTLYFFTSEPQVFPRAVDETRLKDLSTEIVGYLELADLA
jgi:hypothetical protein